MKKSSAKNLKEDSFSTCRKKLTKLKFSLIAANAGKIAYESLTLFSINVRTI